MAPSLENAVSPPAGRKVRQGLTLIEAAMVLTILALVVGAVMLYYSNANLSKKSSATLAQVGIVQQAVRAAYAGQPNYAGLSNSVIAPSLPSSMADGTPGLLYHAFGGPLWVYPVDIGGGANSGYRIFLNGLPREACLKLGAVDLGPSVITLTVDSVPMVMPFTPAQLQAKCAILTDGKDSLEWGFD